MGKKKKTLVEWAEEQKAQQEPEKMTREELVKTLVKVRKKRPLIKSSHG